MHGSRGHWKCRSNVFADLAVGPGTLVGEVDLGFSDRSRQLTGDSSTGAFELTAGYRVYF